jgi:hypothetical protein
VEGNAEGKGSIYLLLGELWSLSYVASALGISSFLRIFDVYEFYGKSSLGNFMFWLIEVRTFQNGGHGFLLSAFATNSTTLPGTSNLL